MGSRRVRLFASIRRRLGFNLARPWRRNQLVRLSVDRLPNGAGVLTIDPPLDPSDTYDVVSLLGWGDGSEWRDGEAHRPRSDLSEDAWLMVGESARLVSSSGDEHWTFYVSFDLARYSDCE